MEGLGKLRDPLECKNFIQPGFKPVIALEEVCEASLDLWLCKEVYQVYQLPCTFINQIDSDRSERLIKPQRSVASVSARAVDSDPTTNIKFNTLVQACEASLHL